MKNFSNIIPVIITITAFTFSVYTILEVGKNKDALESIIRAVGIFGPLIAVLLYGVLSLTPIPSDPLTLLCGALFGPVVGFFTSWMGNNFAALMEYTLGKSVSAATDFEEKRKKLPWGLDKIPVSSPWFLIGGRFVPGFGSKVVSIVSGMYSVRLRTYIWTVGVANTFGSLIYTLGGAGLYKLI